jgi:SARP family transcriptional regulator, regulator of embCAB operon
MGISFALGGQFSAGCVGEALEGAPVSDAQIQLCGRLVVRIGDDRVEDALPGTQGKLLFGFLALNRGTYLSRPQLIEAIWGDRLPTAPENALRALLSKLRGVVGTELIEGKAEIRLALPADASIDVETASEAIHTAEGSVSQRRWQRAWIYSHIAANVTRRRFLAGLEAPWIDEERRALEEIQLRALESLAAAGLGLGGTELDLAERAARSLASRAPYRESGHRQLMEILAARGNVAEALLVYESLRRRLRDDLGVAPNDEVQAVHAELIGGGAHR